MSEPMEIPALGRPTSGPQPRVHRRILDNGLQVVVVRRPSVPMVEMRLRILAPIRNPAALARTTLLDETMLKGTGSHDALDLEQAIGRLGGELSVGSDRDKVSIGGSVLSASLGDYLALLAEVLTGASYPKGEVEDERRRLGEHLVMARSSAGTLAAEAIARKVYGAHPYARVLPFPDEIAAVTPAQVRALHRSRIVPEGAVLVLVGDIQLARTLDAVEEALGSWRGSPAAQGIRRVSFEPSPLITVVDRPGSVQSSIRVGLPAVGRDDTAYPVQQVASMLFGGYFSSRLVRNLREDKGYTYTPRSSIDLGREGAMLSIAADVSTEVTGAAVNEIRYELGRLGSTLPKDDELADAREYLVGSSLIAMSTQAGLASTCANLEIAGRDLAWLRRNMRAISGVSGAAVRAHAERMITPAASRIIVVGDADRIVGQLEPLGETEVAR